MTDTTNFTWGDAVLEAALNRCRETHSGRVPDYGHDYLLARHEYHKLLVACGLLDPKKAEPRPRP